MRTLVIDTATKACSVALYEGDSIIASYHEVIGRGHAERLLPLIAKLPECGKAARIAVDVGPGSFTGIRIGVATARALGLAWDAEVVGYGCLTLMAAMARQATDATTVDVVMAGGHGEYFYESFGAAGQQSSGAVSLAPHVMADQLQASAVAGDFGPEIADMISDREVIPMLPDAASWHLIASLPALAPNPVYGRAPDAKLPKAQLA